MGMLNKHRIIIAGLVAVILLAVAAIVLGLAFVLSTYTSSFRKESAQDSETQAPKSRDSRSDISEPEITEIPLVDSSDVISLTMATSYRGFFEANSKCRKTYNELFGDEDGRYLSSGSACRATISFDRNGNAVKSIEMRRYNIASRSSKVVEKSVWKTNISYEKFHALAKYVVNTDSFKNWPEGQMINTSNTSTTVKHKHGTKQVLANVTEESNGLGTTPMMDAFNQVQLRWKKTQ